MAHTGHVLASNTADAAELERRLRDVTERLEAKRAETATLAGERRELERVVAEALMERRRKERDFRSTRFENDEMDDDDDDAERVTDAPSTEKESARAKKGGLTRRAREKKKPTAGIGVGVFVASAARRVDALGVRAGRRLRRSGGWRSAALLYALGLHVFAFLVLALRALGGGPELKPVEGVDQRRGRA
jgi:hypothetical protein